jgi:hypothetical protein
MVKRSPKARPVKTRSAKAARPKTRNPQDTTLRNTRAVAKKLIELRGILEGVLGLLDALTENVKRQSDRITALEDRARVETVEARSAGLTGSTIGPASSS